MNMGVKGLIEPRVSVWPAGKYYPRGGMARFVCDSRLVSNMFRFSVLDEYSKFIEMPTFFLQKRPITV